jgi:hypothetical protein
MLRLRIKEDLHMAHTVLLGSAQIRGRQVKEILLGAKHTRALDVDIEK